MDMIFIILLDIVCKNYILIRECLKLIRKQFRTSFSLKGEAPVSRFHWGFLVIGTHILYQKYMDIQ